MSTDTPGDDRRFRIGRTAKAAGLVAAGVIAGGTLAATMSAVASETPTPSPTASSSTGSGSNGSGSNGGSSSDAQTPDGKGPRDGMRGPGGPGRPDETPLTGANLEKAKAAALKAVPGGTVERAETDAGDAEYEVHMTKSEGTRVTVKLDKNFAVTEVQEGNGKGDPRPQGPPPGAPNGSNGSDSSSGSNGSSGSSSTSPSSYSNA